MTGAQGTLVVVSTNAGARMFIQQGSTNTGPHNAILDLSGLGTFNLTAGRLLIAGNPGGTVGSNYLSWVKQNRTHFAVSKTGQVCFIRGWGFRPPPSP
jgi:hypothetical protein